MAGGESRGNLGKDRKRVTPRRSVANCSPSTKCAAAWKSIRSRGSKNASGLRVLRSSVENTVSWIRSREFNHPPCEILGRAAVFQLFDRLRSRREARPSDTHHSRRSRFAIRIASLSEFKGDGYGVRERRQGRTRFARLKGRRLAPRAYPALTDRADLCRTAGAGIPLRFGDLRRQPARLKPAAT
jgi:hypothetical protein